MLRKIVKLVLIIICMLIIFFFSSDTAVKSSNKSDRTIVKISEVLKGRKLSKIEKDKFISSYTFIVRKSAHFLLYFILGLLVYSFLLEYSFSNKQIIMFTIGIVFIYACSDEVHQMFISGRSGEIGDVLLDTVAGGCAGILYYTFFMMRRKLNG